MNQLAIVVTEAQENNVVAPRKSLQQILHTLIKGKYGEMGEAFLVSAIRTYSRTIAVTDRPKTRGDNPMDQQLWWDMAMHMNEEIQRMFKESSEIHVEIPANVVSENGRADHLNLDAEDFWATLSLMQKGFYSPTIGFFVPTGFLKKLREGDNEALRRYEEVLLLRMARAIVVVYEEHPAYTSDCTEPTREACPRKCQDFCNKDEEAAVAGFSYKERLEFIIDNSAYTVYATSGYVTCRMGVESGEQEVLSLIGLQYATTTEAIDSAITRKRFSENKA